MQRKPRIRPRPCPPIGAVTLGTLEVTALAVAVHGQLGMAVGGFDRIPPPRFVDHAHLASPPDSSAGTCRTLPGPRGQPIESAP